MMVPMNIVFAGTPEFACASLQALQNSEHNVIAVYTQPDRPAGRGRQLHASPVKALAQLYNIPIYQPSHFNIQEAQHSLAALQDGGPPDLMVVVAYGLILPKAILDTPKYGCINIHASLLPRWRGASPIQHAILAGDALTGISIMQLDEGVDTGPVIQTASCPIDSNDTGQSLHDKLAILGAQTLLSALPHLDIAKTQASDDATYAHKIQKKDAKIDWQQTADHIARQIRAYNPWPVAYSHLHDTPIRIWNARSITQAANANPGTILACDKNSLDVATGNGILQITQLQLPGKKPTLISALVNAYADFFTPGACWQ